MSAKKPRLAAGLENWLRGLDLNQRPSGYEPKTTAPVEFWPLLKTLIFMRFLLVLLASKQKSEPIETPCNFSHKNQQNHQQVSAQFLPLDEKMSIKTER